MQARRADGHGFVEHLGVEVHYELFGDGEPTILLLPTWTLVHKRFWKLQAPYLARHHRVVTYDGPGNGRSDRPAAPAAWRLSATRVRSTWRRMDRCRRSHPRRCR